MVTATMNQIGTLAASLRTKITSAKKTTPTTAITRPNQGRCARDHHDQIHQDDDHCGNDHSATGSTRG
jgi:hypothetical protein